jgi:hypothetical protein
MIVGYKEDDQPDKDDIEVQRNSEFIPTWYVEYDFASDARTVSKLSNDVVAPSKGTLERRRARL